MTGFHRVRGANPSLVLSRLKALIFDLDGTMYKQEVLRRAMVWRILRAYLRHPLRGCRTVRVLQAYRRAQEMLRRNGMTGSPQAQQVRLAAQICKLPKSEVQSCVDFWSEQAMGLLLPALRPGLVELLKLAREKGLSLGVLSDYPAEAKLSSMGLRKYFDVVVTADDPEVQCFKPSSRGLEIVLRRLGLKKDEAVYIGDRPDVDAVAAASAGIPCAILTSSYNGSRYWLKISCFEELSNALRTH